MNIVIIDGQGGQLGAQLVKEINTEFTNVNLTAIGTNASATTAMLKAGAKNAATGENPVVVACRKADVIIGPVGIVIADSLLGEVTAKIAVAVGSANAVRILIPMNKCDNLIAGVPNLNAGALISDALSKLRRIIES
jgi:prephenate dehydrogenase